MTLRLSPRLWPLAVISAPLGRRRLLVSLTESATRLVPAQLDAIDVSLKFLRGLIWAASKGSRWIGHADASTTARLYADG
jgi:hypothetical protein